MNNAIEPEMIYQLVNLFYSFFDIRDLHQYNQLHIKNFLNIQPDQLLRDILTFSKSKPIVLICYSGKRTEELSRQLSQLGFQAYYISGGFQAFLNVQNDMYF